ASYLARDSARYAAILTYRGIVYISNLPEFQGNTDDCQLVYNAILWSDFEIPDHDLSITLDAPQQSSPNETVVLNVTVRNNGLYDESGVIARLLIDDIEVDSLTVPVLQNGTAATFQYLWTPEAESIYNVTAVVDPVPGEDSYENNVNTKLVAVIFLTDYTMIEDVYNWYDAVANGVNLNVTGDDTFVSVPLPFSFQFYDHVFDMVYVSSNGWLSFTNTFPYEFVNPEFPTSDSRFTYALAPMWADLRADNNIYLWSTADRVVIQFENYKYLGGSDVGTFQVVFHSYGIIEFNYQVMYTLYDGTIGLNHGDGIHYNSYDYIDLSGASDFGLQFVYETEENPPEWVSAPGEIITEAGEDFSYQFQVTDETGIVSFTVNDTVNFQVNMHGLLSNRVPLDVGRYGLEITVADPFENELVGTATVVVVDTTPPEWIDSPGDLSINVGDVLAVSVLAEDYCGIDHYSVNDTRFSVSDTGRLTSIIMLSAGVYGLNVSVYDIYGNMNTMIFTLTVIGEETPIDMFLVILVGTFTIIAVGGFAAILLIRKRRGV
ncbi:MAG: CARDB domain-containing protein, partial [Candidatus Thorarchaeota archaeon]